MQTQQAEKNSQTAPRSEGKALEGMAFIDGEYMPMNEAKISVRDFGFIRSDVTYDVVHVWKGRFFRLDQHIARFQRSMDALRMSLPYDKDKLADILTQCVSRSGLRDSYVGMVCSRGTPLPGIRDPRLAVNSFIAYALPFSWILPPERRQQGLHAIVSSYPRIPQQSVDSRIKNYHMLDMVRGLFEAYDQGAEIPIMPDQNGNITEGPGFNVFVVRNGRVATPRAGVLEGITRQTVIEICAEQGIALEVRDVQTSELDNADEVFISSTAGGVMSIARIAGKNVGRHNGVGAITSQLTEIYWAKHADDRYSTAIDYGT